MNWPSPGNDPWYAANPTESLARRNYYSVNATPTHIIDGATATGTPAGIAAAYNTRRAIPSRFWIKAQGSMNVAGDSVIFVARVVADSAISTSVKLRAALVEIEEFWTTPAPNGQTHFPYPFVDFAPDANGFTMVHTGVTTDTVSYRAAFPLRTSGPEPYTLDNCAVVFLVQNETTREILQSYYRKLSTLQFPNGNEMLYVGATESITWDSTAFGTTVSIDLNRDYPTGSWTSLASGVANSGEFEWLVAGPVTTTARVRIYAPGDTANGDMSKSNFTIARPTSITVNPNPITATVSTGAQLGTSITITNTDTIPYIATVETTTGTNGYESEQTVDPGGPTANWIDASAGVVGAMGNDNLAGPFTLPFAFPFYGTTYTQAWMCSNGWMSFTQPTSGEWRNEAFPSARLPGASIGVFWDDLVVAQDTGTVRYMIDTANARVIFSWQNARRWISPATHIYAQAVLYADGKIELNYGQVVVTDLSTTIGMQNEDRTRGVTFYNNVQVPQNNTIESNFSPMWAYPANYTFTVPALDSYTLGCTWDATLLDVGDVMRGEFVFTGNVVPVHVPLTLTVTEVSAPNPVETPSGFVLSEAYPNPFNPSTSFSVTLPKATQLSAKLYDIAGRELTQLVSGRYEAGSHRITFRMDGFASGTYFVKVEADGISGVRKVVLLK